MIRVILDTNVLVSSVLASRPPKVILDLAFNDRFAWFVTLPIFAEYQQVLAYPRLHLDRADIKRTMSAVRQHSRVVSPAFLLDQAAHEEDNRFLECAQEAKANFLGTGNLRHFPKAWKYTKVISPAEFLRLWHVQKPLSQE